MIPVNCTETLQAAVGRSANLMQQVSPIASLHFLGLS